MNVISVFAVLMMTTLVGSFAFGVAQALKRRSGEQPERKAPSWAVWTMVIVAVLIAGVVLFGFFAFEAHNTAVESSRLRVHQAMLNRLSDKYLQVRQDKDRLTIQSINDLDSWVNLEMLVPKGHPPPPEWAGLAGGSLRQWRWFEKLAVKTRWPQAQEPWDSDDTDLTQTRVMRIAKEGDDEVEYHVLNQKRTAPRETEPRLVGYSNSPSNAEDAMNAARWAAAAHLQANLLFYMYPRLADAKTFPMVINNVHGSGLIHQELDVLIENQYTERVPRPAGEFHRAAVMVRADRDTLERLAREFARTSKISLVEPRRPAQSSKERLRAEEVMTTERLKTVEVTYEKLPLFAKAVLGLALVVAVCLIWLFLSAGPRGTWSWPLRFLMLAALAIVYWFMYWFGPYAVWLAELQKVTREIR